MYFSVPKATLVALFGFTAVSMAVPAQVADSVELVYRDGDIAERTPKHGSGYKAGQPYGGYGSPFNVPAKSGQYPPVYGKKPGRPPIPGRLGNSGDDVPVLSQFSGKPPPESYGSIPYAHGNYGGDGSRKGNKVSPFGRPDRSHSGSFKPLPISVPGFPVPAGYGKPASTSKAPAPEGSPVPSYGYGSGSPY